MLHDINHTIYIVHCLLNGNKENNIVPNSIVSDYNMVSHLQQMIFSVVNFRMNIIYHYMNYNTFVHFATFGHSKPLEANANHEIHCQKNIFLHTKAYRIKNQESTFQKVLL